MTDKEKIIDGVDVSVCRQYMPRYMEDYDIDTLDYCRYHFKPCKDVDVKYCYYKQLKRKEQECKNLEEELRGCRIGIKDISIESTEICKISEKYKQALDKIEDIADDYNRVEKTSQYYRDGFDEIQNIINKVKGETDEES